MVEAACEWMFGCCNDDERVYQFGTFTPDAGNCTERILDAIAAGEPLGLEQGGLSNGPAEGLLVLALSINRDRVDINGGAIRACADATADRACNAEIPPPDPEATRCTPTGGEVVEVVCDPEVMFVGNQGVGEECAGQFECAEGLRCIDFGTTGVCARSGAIGDNCFVDAECAAGLICDYSDGTCSEGNKAGEQCAFVDPLTPTPGTESIRCAEGLTCDPTSLLCVGGFCSPGSVCADLANDTDCPEGTFCTPDPMGILLTCRVPSPDGVACSRDETCLSTFCDPTTSVCTSLLPNGDPCNFGDECSSGFCDFTTTTCAATVGTGSMCPSGDSAQCSEGYCDTLNGQVCTAYAEQGGPCPNGDECNPDAALFCIDATCQRAPFPNGVACGDGSQCESGVCFMGMCADGTPIGGACGSPDVAPCAVGSFCEIVDGAAAGVCVELKRPGQPCLRAEQCWGDCVVRYGSLMCDATPAFALGEVWCDETG